MTNLLNIFPLLPMFDTVSSVCKSPRLREKYTDRSPPPKRFPNLLHSSKPSKRLWWHYIDTLNQRKRIRIVLFDLSETMFETMICVS